MMHLNPLNDVPVITTVIIVFQNSGMILLNLPERPEKLKFHGGVDISMAALIYPWHDSALSEFAE